MLKIYQVPDTKNTYPFTQTVESTCCYSSPWLKHTVCETKGLVLTKWLIASDWLRVWVRVSCVRTVHSDPQLTIVSNKG